MKKFILFVPFAEDENNDDLQLKALNWKRFERLHGKEIPEIVIYNEDHSNNLADASKVYILAHGSGNEKSKVINTVESGDTPVTSLDMETLAARFKEAFKNDINHVQVIKLYFCDQTKGVVAKLKADEFKKFLGAEFAHINIEYYSAMVSVPMEISQGHKVALQFLSSTQLPDEKTIEMNFKTGRPSEFRQRAQDPEEIKPAKK